jgi:hypothetical protein
MTITVTSNQDGTFTVTCGNESTIVGRPPPTSSYPKLSTPPNGVATHIINVSGHSNSGKRVGSPQDIVFDLTHNSAGHSPIGSAPPLFEYTLRGQHSIDVAEITRTVRQNHGPDAGVRIFMETVS